MSDCGHLKRGSKLVEAFAHFEHAQGAMTKREREMLRFHILAKAEVEGLPCQIGEDVLCSHLEVYRELIDERYLAGDYITDQQDGIANNISGAKITEAGRDLLETLRSEANAKTLGAKTKKVASLVAKHIWAIIVGVVGVVLGWFLHRPK
jgi:hypothetical protein